MGLFSGPGFALNRLAKTFSECFDCINAYRITSDPDELLKAAWLFAYGVMGSIEKWGFNPYTTRIMVQNHPELGRSPIAQISHYLAGQLTQYGQSADVEDEIDQILERKNVYNSYSYLVSADLKEKLKP